MSLTANNKEGVVYLEGELLFSSVKSATTDVVALIKQAQGALVVDFSGVSRVDSAALTFWLHCVREAEKSGLVLTPANVPANMVSIAELVGMTDWLPLSKAGQRLV